MPGTERPCRPAWITASSSGDSSHPDAAAAMAGAWHQIGRHQTRPNIAATADLSSVLTQALRAHADAINGRARKR